MKKYDIETIFSLLFRYIWVLCAVLLVLEIMFTIHTVNIFTRRTSEDISMATRQELESKIDITWNLADALSHDITLTDTSISLVNRAHYLVPYQETYNLFLIGITNRDGVITSTYDNIPGNIGYRDYFQRVVATGSAEITDAFAAGADTSVSNYTICVPYFGENNTVYGTLIMSIPFDGINDTILNSAPMTGFMFTLLSSENTVMAESDESILSKPFSELVRESPFVSSEEDALIQSVESGGYGSYWTIDSGRLLYVTYTPIARTPWKLLTSIDVISSNQAILMSALSKSIVLILIFALLAFFGRKYAARKLKDVDTLLRQVTKLQSSLREEKLISTNSFEEFAEISQSGLIDNLSGLPTRLGIRRQLEAMLDHGIDQSGVLLNIDLDDLKQINDAYGHEVGDLAIASFGRVLKDLAREHNGVAGRFGGDEFLIYFPEIDPDVISVLTLERLRMSIDAGPRMIDIHGSAGVAVFPQNGATFDELYACGDKVLYEAKRAGKNCYKSVCSTSVTA